MLTTRPKMMRSEGDFETMWREMAQTEQQVWTIAHEPLPGCFSTWEPRLELSEQEEAYCLRAELPGIQRDDITVAYDDGILTVHGEQRLETPLEGTARSIKHGYRAFTRRFVLAAPVEPEGLVVTYTSDGFEAVLPKALPVTVGSTPALAAL